MVWNKNANGYLPSKNKNQFFKYRKINNQKYSIEVQDNPIGEFIQDVDGYFYFWLNKNDGCWSAHHLREIADELDKINKPWNDEIDSYFAKKS